MTTFERNEDGSIRTVPANGALIARVFSTAPIEQATGHAIRLLGEDTFNALLVFIDECHGLPRDEIIAEICENWQSSAQAIMPVIRLLKELPPTVSLKTRMAQYIARMRPDLAAQILPFYKTAGGIETRPAKGTK